MADRAQLLAVLHITAADAIISCWDSKYFFNFWRPVTAARTPSNNKPANVVPSFKASSVQKMSLICTHMLRMPLSVKSRFRKREAAAGERVHDSVRGTCTNCG